MAGGPGAVCATCKGGLYMLDAGGTNPRPIDVPLMTQAMSSPGPFVFSRDSKHAYVPIREKDGTAAIWQLPISGDPERRLIHFSDPTRQPFRTTLDTDSKNFYFTLGDRQSDIWTMELKKQN